MGTPSFIFDKLLKMPAKSLKMQGIMKICPEIFLDALLLTLTLSIITIQNNFDSIPTGKTDVYFFFF